MKTLITAIVILSLAAAAGYIATTFTSDEAPSPGVRGGAAEASLSLKEINDVDMTAEPVTLNAGSIYEVICKVGHPVLVSGWDLDDARFVHFKGPFIQEGHPDKKYRFAYMSTDNISKGSWNTTSFHDSIEEYVPKALPADLEIVRIPIIEAVPAEESALIAMLGEWDYMHARQDSSKRLVYARKVCVQEELREGIYFDTRNGTVVKAKAVTNREKLARVTHDLRTYSEEDPVYTVQQEFVGYGGQRIARNGALDVLLKFVVSRELGRSNEAYDLLSRKDGISDDLRRMALQSEEGVEMDVGSLKYRITDYRDDRMQVLVGYVLENGRSINYSHSLVREEGQWRIAR